MTEYDKQLDEMEKQIPFLAVAAMKLAYHQALAAGLSVLVCTDGAMYEMQPDGSRKFIRNVEPCIPVKAGTTSEIE